MRRLVFMAWMAGRRAEIHEALVFFSSFIANRSITSGGARKEDTLAANMIIVEGKVWGGQPPLPSSTQRGYICIPL